MAGVYYAQTVTLVMLPIAAHQVGATSSMTGLALAIPGAVSLAADLPIAAASDVIGRRWPLLLASGALAVGGAALAASTDVAGILVGMVFISLGLALGIGPSLALVTETGPASGQPRLQGLNGSVQALASIAAAVVAGALITVGEGRVAFATVVAAAIGILGLAMSITRAERSTRALRGAVLVASYRRGWHLLASRGVRLATLLAVVYGVLFLILGNAFLPLFAVAAGVSPAVVGLLLGARTLVIAIVSPTFRRVSARWGVTIPVVATTLMGALGLLLVVVAGATPLVLAPAVLLQGVGVVYGAAAANTWVIGATVEARALAISTSNLGTRVALLVAAPIFGVIADRLGPPSVFMTGSFVVAGCAGLIALLGEPRSADGRW